VDNRMRGHDANWGMMERAPPTERHARACGCPRGHRARWTGQDDGTAGNEFFTSSCGKRSDRARCWFRCWKLEA